MIGEKLGFSGWNEEFVAPICSYKHWDQSQLLPQYFTNDCDLLLVASEFTVGLELGPYANLLTRIILGQSVM